MIKSMTVPEAQLRGVSASACDRMIAALVTRRLNPETTQFTIGDVAVKNTSDVFWYLRLSDDRRDMVRALFSTVWRASDQIVDGRVLECLLTLQRWLNGDDSVDLDSLGSEAVATALREGLRASRASRQAEWAASAVFWLARAAEKADVDGATEAVWYAARNAANAAPSPQSERQAQRADLIGMFPPLVFTEGV